MYFENATYSYNIYTTYKYIIYSAVTKLTVKASLLSSKCFMLKFKVAKLLSNRTQGALQECPSMCIKSWRFTERL